MNDDPFDTSTKVDLESQRSMSSEMSNLRSQLEHVKRTKARNEENLTSCVRVLCYLVVVGLFIAVGLVILVVGLNVVPLKEKEFLVSVVLLVFFGILALLILARNTPQALLGLIFAGLGISCFAAGLAVVGFGKMFQ